MQVPENCQKYANYRSISYNHTQSLWARCWGGRKKACSFCCPTKGISPCKGASEATRHPCLWWMSWARKSTGRHIWDIVLWAASCIALYSQGVYLLLVSFHHEQVPYFRPRDTGRPIPSGSRRRTPYSASYYRTVFWRACIHCKGRIYNTRRSGTGWLDGSSGPASVRFLISYISFSDLLTTISSLGAHYDALQTGKSEGLMCLAQMKLLNCNVSPPRNVQ